MWAGDMSRPVEPVSVQLLTSLFSPEKELIGRAGHELSEIYGPVDWVGPEMFFDRTTYYAREMGWPLHRRILAFKNLIRPESLVDVKLGTNRMEQRYIEDGRRRINIDPGYICPERLILATGKNYTHRIYLSKGIYADLTLIFHKGSFRPLAWTYRDYADPDMIAHFNELRRRYMEALRERNHVD